MWPFKKKIEQRIPHRVTVAELIADDGPIVGHGQPLFSSPMQNVESPDIGLGLINSASDSTNMSMSALLSVGVITALSLRMMKR